ncbi:adult cuticle protein 1-like [Toxorhynchites rutilus septentrionalis]|uniref:adult cuticle protein 1-like n=1 Tax=Toxorhynchites rutilus septentrionalis TaxID=329112 RepID=UPI00247B148A|nr:adult cuticle protein 1-like [Toxorhynchites rutilus septentrionalis]XP_055642170.1 adult cuticle protein 1-like [Toxorhynchites rutilus septentrionalis]XP_055645396.1 adult cuticle protein 1-like [Toxorhynchites rutilus septentrionalis]
MKCIAAVVMMVLALTEGALVPLAYSSPLALAAPHTTVVQQNLGAPLTYAAPLAYSAVAPAISYAAHASVVPTAYVHQPAIAVLAQQEGRYLAATRGAIHDAPLEGHAISQQSLNLAPAPGTL